jgi:hypothetical protein
MSSLWTPGGEHPVGDPRSRAPRRPPAASGAGAAGGRSDGPDGAGAGPTPVPDTGESLGDTLGSEEEVQLAADLDELRRQLVATPAEVVVANHAYGLFELAAIHLSQRPPDLDQARLAVDAMGAVVEALAGRLGEAEDALVAALAQIRLAYVQITGSVRAPSAADAARPGAGAASEPPGAGSGP